MERALISVLMEEFMDDSLELDNFVLQSTSTTALSSLAVLACFDNSSRSSEPQSQIVHDDDIPSSPEPRPTKRRRGRGRGGSAGGVRRRRGSKLWNASFEALAECVIPKYSDMDFKSNFGMSRVTFEEICCMIAPALASRTIKTEKKLLLTLWILRSRESYGMVSVRFDVSRGSLLEICGSVCNVLSVLGKRYIKLPNEEDMEDVAQEFQEWCHIPGVVGVIGCTHFPIREPLKDTKDFINKEGSFSIQLQIVCDSQLRLLDAHSGSPGSMKSGEVFHDSPLFLLLEDSYLPSSKHILGDCSYPLKPYLLVPFDSDGEVNELQEQFNQKLTHACSKVEHVIKLFKSKFQRLKFIDMKQVDDIPKMIMAACVLYNFILLKENISDFDPSELDEGHDEFEVDFAPEPYLMNNEVSENAFRKRLEVAESLISVSE